MRRWNLKRTQGYCMHGSRILRSRCGVRWQGEDHLIAKRTILKFDRRPRRILLIFRTTSLRSSVLSFDTCIPAGTTTGFQILHILDVKNRLRLQASSFDMIYPGTHDTASIIPTNFPIPARGSMACAMILWCAHTTFAKKIAEGIARTSSAKNAAPNE